MGIPTSRNPNTPEGLESRLSVGIHRIPLELPHLTELEPGNIHRTRMDSGRVSALELFQGLPTSREVLSPSEPCLSLYSTKIEFRSPLGGAKPHFLHTFCRGEHRGIYKRSKAVLCPKIGHVGPRCQDGHSCNLAGGPVSSLHRLSKLDTMSTASARHVGKMFFVNVARHGWPATLWLD